MENGSVDEKERLLDHKGKTRKLYSAVNDTGEESEKDRSETLHEYKTRWKSIKVIYLLACFGSVEFAIVMSSLWPYLQKVDAKISETFLGWTNSGFSLSQLIGSFVFGIWCHHRPAIEPLIFSQVVLAAGGILYAYAQSFNTFAPYVILIARLLLGFSTGNMAVCRSVVSQSTTLNERVKAFANLAIAQALGFFFGPAMQVAVVPVGKKSYYYKPLRMHIDIFTLPGFIGAFMGLISIVAILMYFRERKVDIYEGKANEWHGTSTGDVPKPDFKAIGIMSVMFFVLLSVFSLNETIMTPLLMDEFAWTSQQAVLYGGIILSVSGVIAVLSFLFVKFFVKRYGEARVLALGLVITIAGFIVYLPWGNQYPILKTNMKLQEQNGTFVKQSVGCPVRYSWCTNTPKIYLPQFLVAAALVGIGYPVGFLVANTIYSQLLGPRKQGTYMAWLTAVGSSARVIGPLLVSSAYEEIGPRWTFLIVDFILAFSILLLGTNFHRIVPFHKYARITQLNV